MSTTSATAAVQDTLELGWRRLAEATPQLRIQASRPEQWRRFYDRAAPHWEMLTAGVPGVGAHVAELARERGLMRPDERVIEVGCGAGNLALAMAERGARVTAVDESRGMIGVLEDRLRDRTEPNVAPVLGDWHRLRRDQAYDLAVACCLPDALRPDGLRRLEGLSRRHCLVVLGHGQDAFPLRRQIWRRVMDEPLPPTGRMLPFVVGALRSMGRQPHQLRLSWSSRLDVEADWARDFFLAYFTTLGRTGVRLREAIEHVIKPHLHDGRVQCQGRINLAAVWWRAVGSGAAQEAEDD